MSFPRLPRRFGQLVILGALVALVAAACARLSGPDAPPWEAANPIVPLPDPPLGIDSRFEELEQPPTPERVRLGRWLFYDSRLSADGTVSCATCHRPDQGFSADTPRSAGVHGRLGTRKAQPIVNAAWPMFPHFFWDGRAASLEEQALGPITNPVEMGLTEAQLVEILEGIPGYRPYFAEAFGTPEITPARVAHAIADYERTRMSGNSPYDRWRRRKDESAVSDQVKRGHELFFGRAGCSQCHLGQNFTDSRFHNLGVGWDPATKRFSDEGRYTVTKRDEDRGAFKTPTLRDLKGRAPYMHDGSIATLRETIELYNRGGTKNPWLSPKISPLGLTDDEIDALVAMLEALNSDLPVETPPSSFPQ